jgi:hypothetical protein
MGLALCHVLPRDNILRLCIFIMTSAFILQAIALGMRRDRGSVGVISSSLSALALQGDISIWDVTNNVLLCDTNNDVGCGTYAKRMTGVVGLLLAAFITCPIAVFIVAVFVAPNTSTTARMISYFWILTLIPSGLTLIATAHFFNNALPLAVDLVPGGTFSRGNIANLLIASCALYIFNFVLTSLRGILSLFVRPSQKQQMIESRDINGVVSLHMVNDDWKRQNDMWDMHARSVHVAVVQRSSRQPDSAGASPPAPHFNPNNATMTSVGSVDEDREYRRDELPAETNEGQ